MTVEELFTKQLEIANAQSPTTTKRSAYSLTKLCGGLIWPIFTSIKVTFNRRRHATTRPSAWSLTSRCAGLVWRDCSNKKVSAKWQWLLFQRYSILKTLSC